MIFGDVTCKPRIIKLRGRRRRENNEIVEEGIAKKIEEGIKKFEEGNNKIVEEEGNRNEKGDE